VIGTNDVVSSLSYSPVPRKSREEILNDLKNGSTKEIATALLSAAYWDPDWKWAEKQLIRFAAHSDGQVLWTVASGLGLLAAFHGQVDLEIVEPILQHLRRDTSVPGLADAAENSIDEINHFVRRRRAGEPIDLAGRMPEAS
jgi:hypothetical protein